MSTTESFRINAANRILKGLPVEEYERLSDYLEPVSMSLGEVLCHPDERITHVYFPNRGTVSLVSVFDDGRSVEVGMVGNEGMFGVCVFLGSISTPLLAQVQLPGDGLRMRAGVLQREFKKGGPLQDLLLRYTQVFITQIAQTAACNRAHSVEGRLSKWLLMCGDRANSKDLELTHDFIGMMLGVRRAGVTEAALTLKSKGLIEYRRGHLTIRDRQGLESITCECYAVVKKEFARLIDNDGHA